MELLHFQQKTLPIAGQQQQVVPQQVLQNKKCCEKPTKEIRMTKQKVWKVAFSFTAFLFEGKLRFNCCDDLTD